MCSSYLGIIKRWLFVKNVYLSILVYSNHRSTQLYTICDHVNKLLLFLIYSLNIGKLIKKRKLKY